MKVIFSLKFIQGSYVCKEVMGVRELQNWENSVTLQENVENAFEQEARPDND